MAEGRDGILQLPLSSIAHQKMDNQSKIVQTKWAGIILSYNVNTDMPVAFMLRNAGMWQLRRYLVSITALQFIMR